MFSAANNRAWFFRPGRFPEFSQQPRVAIGEPRAALCMETRFLEYFLRVVCRAAFDLPAGCVQIRQGSCPGGVPAAGIPGQ